MPKLYSSEDVDRALRKKGFVFVSQRGSHIKYSSTGNPKRIVIVPARRKVIPMGTLYSIVRQAQFTMKDLED